ncbi:non-heme iron oxygenase ferredoxin subunit [Janibacter sp. GXQ6167]|uniref:non-heme iron oxygenase ferredoxin subunit n=1 Tax=Janibacter sp. GXQ6167 TaxID=3240791 RepID=UPI003523AC17
MSAPASAEPILVCSVGELPEVGAAKADIHGRLVSIVHTDDGGVYCIDDACTHGNVSLSEGELSGCQLECWLHGSRFDVRTGEPSGLPATVPVVTHTVEVIDGQVWVTLSETPPRRA